MKRAHRVAPLPGEGNPHNLVPQGDGIQACPCCGALWKGGSPWSDTTLNTQDVAERMGITRSAVLQRLAIGTLAGYRGATGEWLVPIYTVPPKEG